MHQLLYKDIVTAALKEDLGFGDLTTETIFADQEGKAEIMARERGIAAGLAVAAEAFAQVDPRIVFTPSLNDGDNFAPGDVLAVLHGPLAGILTAERVALNFLQRLSGIATATGNAVNAVRGTGVKILDTRKTTPGLRVLEKYAVRTGGGENHRYNLSDLVLIKDNHIHGAGSISEAVARVRKRRGFAAKIEVEAATLKDVKEALECGVEIIMLDNMDTSQMAEAVKIIAGRALIEASGAIRQEQLQKVAATGVDYISLGSLTHSCRALDLSLNLL
ncbi:MAG: carboxylating nicotinate-nucleotide diphosphorylase [Dethiobacter sp.]|nr:carboxylating nicotinate-nucleotide diphosphorylase [Dethiobacter sp.]